MLRPDRFPIEMSQEDLLALSTLCAYSSESEETIRTHGHESSADDIRESRDGFDNSCFARVSGLASKGQTLIERKDHVSTESPS